MEVKIGTDTEYSWLGEEKAPMHLKVRPTIFVPKLDPLESFSP